MHKNNISIYMTFLVYSPTDVDNIDKKSRKYVIQVFLFNILSISQKSMRFAVCELKSSDCV